MVAMSPALTGVGVCAETEKSTTLAFGWVKFTGTEPPFPLTLPETVSVELMTGLAGVMSTSTVAGLAQGRGVHTARVGIKQEMVPYVPEPCTAVHVLELLV